MSELQKPEISAEFTIQDIHKIREWNFERRRGMTSTEINADTKRGADEFLKLIQSKKPMTENTNRA